MVWLGNYITDTGYRLTMVSLTLKRINDSRLARASGETVEQFIPQSIRDRYRNDLEGCGVPKGIRLRKVLVTAKSGLVYQIDLPLSPSEVGWIQLISDLNNNNLIENFEIVGERIKPWFLRQII